jgi:hypothetical protein
VCPQGPRPSKRTKDATDEDRPCGLQLYLRLAEDDVFEATYQAFCRDEKVFAGNARAVISLKKIVMCSH